MSLYTVPPLNAVNFALAGHTVPSLASPPNVLAAYSAPALNAVNFALIGYTVPDYMNIGWELLPSVGFPTQYAGLRYFNGTVRELCLVALADAPPGNRWEIDKNGTTYAVYLVDPSDPDASGVRVETTTGIKAARYKT